MQNPELGRKILDVIDGEPERFDMRDWGREGPCGTVACLAGHAMLLSGYKLSFARFMFLRPDGTVVLHEGREAEILLGLSDEEIFGKGCHNRALWHDRHGGPDRFRKLVEESEGRI